MGSPRPRFPPTHGKGVRGPRQPVRRPRRLQEAGPPPRLRRWERAPTPRGAEPVSPCVRRGVASGAARGAAGPGAQSPRGRGPRRRWVGDEGTGGFTVQLRAPPQLFCAARAPALLFPAAAKAAAARRPRPLPPVPSLKAPGVAARRGAQSRARTAAGGPASPLLPRRRVVNSDFLGLLRLLAGVSYRFWNVALATPPPHASR